MPQHGASADRQWGRLPNVYRNAPSMEAIRDHPSFEALPPVSSLRVGGPDSHRYVRQDDPLWDLLHAGVLTTGMVRGALGLYEKSAAKKLGIPSSRTGHGGMLQAYHRLRQQPADHGSADTAAAAAVAAHNAAAVAAFNARKWAAAGQPTAATAQAPGSRQDVAQDQAPGPAATPSPAAPPGLSRSARQRLKRKAAQAAAAAARTRPAPEAGAGVCWGVSEEQKMRKARALSSLGLMSICCSWGSAQEAAALLQVAGAFPRSQLAEVGLCRLRGDLLPPAWGFAPGSLPPIGASPDALIRHGTPPPPAGQGAATQQARGASAAACPSPAGPWDIDGLLERMQLTGDGAAGGGGSPAGPLAQPEAGAGWLVEVVEVKNTCPFGHSRRGGRLRKTEFAVADRGPRMAVPPEWVPQLQLHMLCAGTPSGLLVSRSATKGTRVYRMQRNDQLLHLMLLVISRLWRQHVLAGQPPAADVFASWREHHDMLRCIVQTAREAQLVATIEDAHHPLQGDSRWFLD